MRRTVMDSRDVGVTVGNASHVVSRLYAAGVLEVDPSVPFNEHFADDVKMLARALIDAKTTLEKEYGATEAPTRRATGGFKPSGGGSGGATVKQVNYAKSLLTKNGHDADSFSVEDMTKQEVGKLIENLLAGVDVSL
jgi:hypothetical protein